MGFCKYAMKKLEILQKTFENTMGLFLSPAKTLGVSHKNTVQTLEFFFAKPFENIKATAKTI